MAQERGLDRHLAGRARFLVAVGNLAQVRQAGKLDEHTPVLVDEVLAALAVRPAGHYVDATFGRGGHSERDPRSLGPQGRLVAIDRDPEAIAAGRARFASEARLTLVHGAFGELAALLRAANPQVALSTASCSTSASPRRNSTMRRAVSASSRTVRSTCAWIRSRGEPAVAGSPGLARGNARRDRQLRGGALRAAHRRAIVRERAREPLTRTAQLAAADRAARCRRASPASIPRRARSRRCACGSTMSSASCNAHSPQALALLTPRRAAGVISFHSLEDGVVREFLRRAQQLDPALAGLPADSGHMPCRDCGASAASNAPAPQKSPPIRARAAPCCASQSSSARWRRENCRARWCGSAMPLLWVGVLASAAGAIYCKHRARELFVELEHLNRGRDELEIEWGRLQLEQSSWSTHAFVESVASAELQDAHPQLQRRRDPHAMSRAGLVAQRHVSARPDRSARPISFRMRLGLVFVRAAGARRARSSRARCTCSSSTMASSPAGRCALHARRGDRRAPRHDHRSLRRAARGQHAGRFGVGQPAGARRKHRAAPAPGEGARTRPARSGRGASARAGPRVHLPGARTAARRCAQGALSSQINGVYLAREYRRYYPAGEVTGHLLGFTDIDDAARKVSSSPSTTGSPARTAPSA